MELEEFCTKIGYQFNKISLLQESLTHPSFSKHSKNKFNYQRLEFLGDKVLSLVISEFLIKKYDKENEGDLSKRQAFLVSGEVLSGIALEIGINDVLKLSNGEEALGGKLNKRNLENALEAIIGAIYLDSNYQNAQKFIFKFWQELLETKSNPPKDPVSKLQEFVQLQTKQLPQYEIIKSGGTQHSPEFEAIVKIEHLDLEIHAQGKSKKEAQKKVAEMALEKLEII